MTRNTIGPLGIEPRSPAPKGAPVGRYIGTAGAARSAGAEASGPFRSPHTTRDTTGWEPQLEEMMARGLASLVSDVTRALDALHYANEQLEAVKQQLAATVGEARKVPNAPVILASSIGGWCVVYGLRSSGAPARMRYIGSTSAPWTRWLGHHETPAVRDWLAAESAAGHETEMVQLWAGIGRDLAYGVEAQCIAEAVAQGDADLNAEGNTRPFVGRRSKGSRKVSA